MKLSLNICITFNFLHSTFWVPPSTIPHTVLHSNPPPHWLSCITSISMTLSCPSKVTYHNATAFFALHPHTTHYQASNSSQSQWFILVPLLQLMVVIDCEIRSQLIDQAPLNQFGIHCREKKNIAVKKCIMRDCTHSCLRYEITEDHQNVSKICNRYVEITLKSNIEQ